MILTTEQIRELLRYIEFQHVVFIGDNVGHDVLTSDDIATLRAFGVDTSKRYMKDTMTPIEEAYHFGRLSAALGNYQASKIDYNDFRKFVMHGGHSALSDVEKSTLNVIKNRTYGYIKSLGQKIGSALNTVIDGQNEKQRAKLEKMLRDESIKTVENRRSLKDMILELGHRSGTWNRDLGRIVETEMHNAFDLGRAAEIEKLGGADALVYKDVYPGACKYCINLYLTGGIGSEPKVFKLSTLISNGSNVGVRAKDWKPVVGSTHPYCRCTLNDVPADYDWDKETKSFTKPREIKRKSAVQRGNIIVTIGDKKYTI